MWSFITSYRSFLMYVVSISDEVDIWDWIFMEFDIKIAFTSTFLYWFNLTKAC